MSEGVYAFEARMYSATLGRFFSRDPREAEYAWQSTYAYYRNCPTAVLDFLGMGGGDSEDRANGMDDETSCLNTDASQDQQQSLVITLRYTLSETDYFTVEQVLTGYNDCEATYNRKETRNDHMSNTKYLDGEFLISETELDVQLAAFDVVLTFRKSESGDWFASHCGEPQIFPVGKTSTDHYLTVTPDVKISPSSEFPTSMNVDFSFGLTGQYPAIPISDVVPIPFLEIPPLITNGYLITHGVITVSSCGDDIEVSYKHNTPTENLDDLKVNEGFSTIITSSLATRYFGGVICPMEYKSKVDISAKN